MSSPASPTVPAVFITGATGTQGLALAHLLRLPAHNLNWRVHATVRDPSSPAALELASLGVCLFPTSTLGWSDTATIAQALATCTHLFLNTVPSYTDPSLEHKQTTAILALARQSGTVRHVIFSSALAVDRLSELAVFDPNTLLGQTLLFKAATEETLRGAGFERWTILRPASFMANLLVPKAAMYGPALVRDRVWRMACKETDVLPLVDAADIAAFAVAAFREPERFHGKEVPIAGDELTFEQIAAELSRVVGEIEGEGGRGRIRYVAMSEEEVEREEGNPMVLAQLALRELVRFVKVEKCREWGIKLGTSREFLDRERELVKRTYCEAI